jgi:hypothetical protein
MRPDDSSLRLLRLRHQSGENVTVETRDLIREAEPSLGALGRSATLNDSDDLTFSVSVLNKRPRDERDDAEVLELVLSGESRFPSRTRSD